MAEEISYDDFAKLDIRIGTIIAAARVPDTDKLIKCTIDFGEPPAGLGVRTIVSGIALSRAPETIVGKQCPYIVNLSSRVLRGIESRGMLLAVGLEDGIALLHPDEDVPPGARIR